MLNQLTILNSMSIQLQDAQVTHLLIVRYTPFAEDSPNYTIGKREE